MEAAGRVVAPLGPHYTLLSVLLLISELISQSINNLECPNMLHLNNGHKYFTLTE